MHQMAAFIATEKTQAMMNIGFRRLASPPAGKSRSAEGHTKRIHIGQLLKPGIGINAPTMKSVGTMALTKETTMIFVSMMFGLFERVKPALREGGIIPLRKAALGQARSGTCDAVVIEPVIRPFTRSTLL